jgi:replication factor A1
MSILLRENFWQISWVENLNHKKATIMEALAFLSVKQNVYVAELYEALVAAREKGKINCQKLTVDYRCSVKGEAIFLITKESRVVVQFRVEEEFLQRKDICFENWMDTDKIRRQMNRQNTSKESILVQDLRHGMKKVNVEAKVLETPLPSTVQTRYGNSARVANAWIADETGKIKLCLWNEQVDFVNVGDTVQIKNASVSTFKGERQLRLGKAGSVNVLQKVAG